MHTQYWERNIKNKNKQAATYASNSQNKKQKPKQQWTTDFIDRSQFKLSESEMIQKKASLQSKHRQQAKKLLEQRRKKLQMGILDDQTRKIYQTALTSKNIDINPPVRKNLTEMIRQQRDRRIENQQAQQYSENQDDESDNQDIQQNADTAQDIKDAQNFIKKFERAKKQQKISRAVQILTNDSQNNRKSPKNSKSQQNNKDLKINNFLDYMNQEESQGINSYEKLSKYKKQSSSYREPQNLSQQEAITSIQDTIKFMQERLFAAKKTVEQTSKSFIQPEQIEENYKYSDKSKQQIKNTVNVKSKVQQFKKDKKCYIQQQSCQPTKSMNKINNKKQSFDQINNLKESNNVRNNFIHQADNNDEEDSDFNERLAEISQLRIKIKQQQDNSSQDDNECMDTIRRMRELMESRISDNGNGQDYGYDTIQKQRQEQQKSYKRLKENVREDNFLVSPSVEGLTVSSINKKSDIKGNKDLNYDDSGAEVSFSLTNNEDSLYQVDFLGASSKISKRSNEGKSQKIKSNIQIQHQQQPKRKQMKNNKNLNINNQNKYQLSYQDQYQKVKQNLFKCLEEPISKNGNQQYQSEDSLIVNDRINVWKKQLNTEDQQQEEQIQFGKGFNKKKNINNLKDQSKNRKTNAYFLKQQHDIDEDQQLQEQPYKYNCFTDKNYQYSADKEEIKSSSGYSYGQMNSNNSSTTNKSLKKPPIQKSYQNNQMNSMKTLISNMANNVQKIQIMPLKIEPLATTSTQGQMVGFDFRGSINIKKNVLSK